VTLAQNRKPPRPPKKAWRPIAGTVPAWLLEYLEREPRAITSPEIAELTGIRTKSVTSTLSGAVKAGALEKVGRGHGTFYRRPGSRVAPGGGVEYQAPRWLHPSKWAPERSRAGELDEAPR
jgi:hypothetical protein